MWMETPSGNGTKAPLLRSRGSVDSLLLRSRDRKEWISPCAEASSSAVTDIDSGEERAYPISGLMYLNKEAVMEILEQPIIHESDEVQSWPELPPVNLAEQEMDIEAFELWRDASRIDPSERD